MVKSKASNRSNFLEEKWKPILDIFETSTLRRGRTLQKQGQVMRMKVKDGRVTAEVQGSKIRSQAYHCTVSFACTDWKVNAFDGLAKLLYERPLFLAALFAGEWETDFWNALTNAGIRWFPDEDIAREWRQSLTCTCNEPYVPCTHVAAAVYALLHEIEGQPLQMLRFIGINDKDLVDAVHRLGTAGQSDELDQSMDTKIQGEIQDQIQDETDSEVPTREDNSAAEQSLSAFIPMWMEEKSVWSRSQMQTDDPALHLPHGIRPEWDEGKLQALKERILPFEERGEA